MPTFSPIKVPIKQRDGRSYKEVVNEKPVRNVTYQTSEEDREWLSRSLVGLISNGTDYAKIKKKDVDDLAQHGRLSVPRGVKSNPHLQNTTRYAACGR